jgi:exodeoxyribonuclease III
MRLVTWNCRVGNFQQKAERIAALTPPPDVLVVQEVENLDSVLLFGGASQPNFRHRTIDSRFPKRGTGVFSYTGAEITSVDEENAPFGFQRYEVRLTGLSFNLAAVWTWATKVSADSYRQAHQGLETHGDWLRQRPTVVLGDFNMNEAGSGGKWRQLRKLLDSFGLVSAYHTASGESFGAETQHTHFHKGDSQKPFHIDYCFIPSEWSQGIRGVNVPPHAEWRDVSDHVPLIVDLDV